MCIRDRYEELMWDNDDVLEFVADYKNDRIIIKHRSRENEIDCSNYIDICFKSSCPFT